MKHMTIIGLAVVIAFVAGFFAGARILEFATGYTVEFKAVDSCVEKFERGCLKYKELLGDR